MYAIYIYIYIYMYGLAPREVPRGPARAPNFRRTRGSREACCRW